MSRLPGVATSASRGDSVAAVAAARVGSARLMASALRGVDAVQLPMRARGVRVVTRRLVSTVHAVGAEVHVWTVNDVDDMSRLLALGVDGIVTDRADLAMSLLEG